MSDPTGADAPSHPSAESEDRPGRLATLRRATPTLRATVGQFTPYLALSTATFGLAALVGYTLVGPAVAEDVTVASGGIVGGHSVLEYVRNNGLVAAGLIGGFGVVTLGILAFNGVTLGVAVYAGLAAGLAPGRILALIAPHGVVEIPALVLAGAVGFFLARRTTAWALDRRREIVSAVEERRFYAALVLVYTGIVVAALIETHLTPRL
jgi:Uncharacterized membrane protein